MLEGQGIRAVVHQSQAFAKGKEYPVLQAPSYAGGRRLTNYLLQGTLLWRFCRRGSVLPRRSSPSARRATTATSCCPMSSRAMSLSGPRRSAPSGQTPGQASSGPSFVIVAFRLTGARAAHPSSMPACEQERPSLSEFRRLPAWQCLKRPPYWQCTSDLIKAGPHSV